MMGFYFFDLCFSGSLVSAVCLGINWREMIMLGLKARALWMLANPFLLSINGNKQ